MHPSPAPSVGDPGDHPSLSLEPLAAIPSDAGDATLSTEDPASIPPNGWLSLWCGRAGSTGKARKVHRTIFFEKKERSPRELSHLTAAKPREGSVSVGPAARRQPPPSPVAMPRLAADGALLCLRVSCSGTACVCQQTAFEGFQTPPPQRVGEFGLWICVGGMGNCSIWEGLVGEWVDEWSTRNWLSRK